jgi:hypothetical protein
MTGDTDRLQILDEYSRIPTSSIRYMADADADVVRSIDNDILFLVAFFKLTKAIHSMGVGDFELVAVDMDGSPEI